MTTKRLHLGLLAAALCSSTMLALPAQAQEPVTIEIWSWHAAAAETYNQIFDAYEAINPDVKIDFRGYPSTEYPAVIATALSADGGPDMVMLHPYNSIAPYVLAGQLDPLDPTTFPELTTAFTPEAVAASSMDGQIYGVPFGAQTIQLFYRTSIFEELGLTEPTTLDEVQPMLDAIVAAGKVPFSVSGKDAWQLVNVFDALVGNTYGGQAFVDKVLAGETVMTDPAMVAALEQFKAWEPYYPKFASAVSYDDSQALFNSGEAVLYPGGSWMLAGFRDANPEDDIGVFSMPADNSGGPAPTFGYEDGSFGLSARSEHKDIVLDIMKWMATPEFGQLYSDTLKYASSVKGVAPTDPVLQEMIANYQANPVKMMWVTDYFGVTPPAPYAGLMNAAQNMLIGAMDATAAAQAIDASVQEWNAQATAAN